MKLLLDTHVWLWLRSAPDRLSRAARAAIEDEGNALYFSAACAWEIATKNALGKLPLPTAPDAFVRDTIKRTAAVALSIGLEHAARAGLLPGLHRDPFDRLLVAQAQAERCRLVTIDKEIAAYDVDVLWR